MPRALHYLSALVFTISWQPLNAQQVRCEVASQTDYSLNYRDRPSLNGTWLGSFNNGEQLLFDASEHLAVDEDGRLWAYVYTWDGSDWWERGWVSKAYLNCNDGNVGRRAIAMAYCHTDSTVSIGKGFASFNTLSINSTIAGAEAIQNCVAGSARPDCCEIVLTVGAVNGCIALSRSEFSFGAGEGKTWQEAVNMANSNCGDNECRALASSCIDD